MRAIEPDALGRLYDGHSAALVLYARSWCVGPEAEDVVQESFLSLAAQWFAPRDSVAWLYRTVRNRAISVSRSRGRRRRRETMASSDERLFDSTDERIDASH